ncbi:hypothetical protein BH20ACT23_BH20ACT23_16590 [soil metagenome]
MSTEDQSREPELHVFESERGRFVLSDGSDPIATTSALLGVEESQLDHLKDETPKQNRARLIRLELKRRYSFGHEVGDSYTPGQGPHRGHTITVTGFHTFVDPTQFDNVQVRCECDDEWEFMDLRQLMGGSR